MRRGKKDEKRSCEIEEGAVTLTTAGAQQRYAVSLLFLFKGLLSLLSSTHED